MLIYLNLYFLNLASFSMYFYVSCLIFLFKNSRCLRFFLNASQREDTGYSRCKMQWFALWLPDHMSPSRDVGKYQVANIPLKVDIMQDNEV